MRPDKESFRPGASSRRFAPAVAPAMSRCRLCLASGQRGWDAAEVLDRGPLTLVRLARAFARISGEPPTTIGGRRQFRERLMYQLTRRGFIGGVAALSAAGPASLWSSPLTAQAGGGGPLPARGEFTIANAYVMTM